MLPFEFKCRAVDLESSCGYKGQPEPTHPDGLTSFIEEVLQVTQELEFAGRIKSRKNDYAINLDDFDARWTKKVALETAWRKVTESPKIESPHIILDVESKKFSQVPTIIELRPDALLSNGIGSVPNVVEKGIGMSYPIEKQNKRGRICRWRKDTTRDRN